ncbi:MAG: transcription antitermination factor NusB [Burkholderiales bacterium]|nr:transcription antitermination factor NusB [Burkholderiales bacterium]
MTTPRRRAREFALQGIYQWQYTGEGAAQVLKNLSELEEFDDADHDFLEAQLSGTVAESEALRARIEPLADRKWEELSPIERGILLLAAWELVHKQDIPYRVTINEAIELGKKFGGTDGHKYVNGVLDRLAAAVRAEEVAAPRTARPRRNKGKA